MVISAAQTFPEACPDNTRSNLITNIGLSVAFDLQLDCIHRGQHLSNESKESNGSLSSVESERQLIELV